MYYLNLHTFKIKRKHLQKIGVSVFFLLLISVFGCTKERKIQNSEQEVTAFKKQLQTVLFSKRAFSTKEITKESHYFSSKIAFKEARVYINKKENDTYTFVWIVDATHTDFEELKKWKLGMITKPKNRADFKDKDLEKKGIKTMGVLTKPFLLDGEICIVLRDFKFKPKEIAYIKFYLYNDAGRANLNYWTTENVSLKL